MVKTAHITNFDDRLRHERTVPLCFVCGVGRGDGQLQHGRVLTFIAGRGLLRMLKTSRWPGELTARVRPAPTSAMAAHL